MIFKNLIEKALEVRKVLKIKNEILSVDYFDKNFDGLLRKDTACTAIARSFKKRDLVIINSESHKQLCSGGDYFLKIKDISDKEAMSVYVDTEKVFKNNEKCKMFLKDLPKFPKSLRNKNIVIGPLRTMKNASVIMFLVTPAQVGRIIGLLNYKKYSKIEIIPNQSTCISLFAPLVNGKPHINLIDYYDRYYQGDVCGKRIWSEAKMIVSMTLAQFKEVCDNLHISPQGSFVPNLHPKEVDCI